jgi:hypothetical protein
MLLIKAAASGQGVALVTEILAKPELARRALVKAIDLGWPHEFAYWLVYPDAKADTPKIAAFRQGLLAQSESRPNVIGGLTDPKPRQRRGPQPPEQRCDPEPGPRSR